MFKKINDTAFIIVLISLVSALVWNTYQAEQIVKEMNELLQSNMNTNIESQGINYTVLMDISCSLSNVSKKDRQILDVYINGIKMLLEDDLKEDYLREETKSQIMNNLEYIPYECR